MAEVVSGDGGQPDSSSTPSPSSTMEEKITPSVGGTAMTGCFRGPRCQNPRQESRRESSHCDGSRGSLPQKSCRRAYCVDCRPTGGAAGGGRGAGGGPHVDAASQCTGAATVGVVGEGADPVVPPALGGAPQSSSRAAAAPQGQGGTLEEADCGGGKIKGSNSRRGHHPHPHHAAGRPHQKRSISSPRAASRRVSGTPPPRDNINTDPVHTRRPFVPNQPCSDCIHTGGNRANQDDPFSPPNQTMAQTPGHPSNVKDAPEVGSGGVSGIKCETSGNQIKLPHVDSTSSLGSQEGSKLPRVDSTSSLGSQECTGNCEHVKARRKKKLGTRKKSGGEPLSEGECDDTSSEHSVCSKTKKKKRSRRHCDIHNPIKAAKAAIPCDVNPSSQDGSASQVQADTQKDTQEVQSHNNEKTLVCTCSKSSKRSRSRVRPEPEGGSSQMPSQGSFCDEFDRVIFNNDPIFSDMEFDAKEDAQIRTEMERYHKRSNHPDIFSAAQMVNTNTMLKFALIGAELQNISSVSLRRAESEVGALTRRIRLLEEDFEATENRLQDATSKLEEASKAADESERARKAAEGKSLTDDERIDSLESQLKEAKYIAEDADRKYDEAARKLAITEVDLERAEARLEAAEAKINELEEELKVVGNNMKSLEISEQEASQREDSYEESIRDLTARLKDAENRATEAERTVSKLQKEVDRLEDELLGEKEKYKSIGEELDTTFAELAGF